MKLFIRLLVVSVLLAIGLSFQAAADTPAAPQLDVPKDKAKNQVLTTVFKWKDVPGAQGYRLLVALSADSLEKLQAGAPCADCLVDQKVTTPTYQVPPKVLTKNAPHFWTVRAIGPSGEGPNAPVRSYTFASTFFADMD